MSDEHGTDKSLSEEDATRLKQTYNILAGLQRKTLSFFRALGEYEKRDRRQRSRDGSGDDGPSRIAFIVTPLMVNHYNHMHRVYRASMYGKVPDLCEQTGGIVCADLSALREELASSTTDVNRSLARTFSTTVLPNVTFDFKNQRDNVLESVVHILDSMNVKQPDLTYGIRDDYVQNVRAIQESLTNALEKSKERTLELQSRLDDALRKLALCEKNMISTDSGDGITEDLLRREILKLKDTILEQQHRLLEQEASFNERFVNLVRSNEESELLGRLRDRLQQQQNLTANKTDGLARLRKELLEYAEKEMEQMRVNLERIREDVIGYRDRVLARSGEDREETRKLFQTLLSRDEECHRNDVAAANKDLADRLLQLQNDNARLREENESLQRECAESRQSAIDLQKAYDELNQHYAIKHEESIDAMRRENEDLKQRFNAIHGEQIQLLTQENERSRELLQQLQLFNAALEKDLNLVFNFIADNVNAAYMLGGYMYDKSLLVHSEISRSKLIPYLETILTDERVKTYIQTIETARAEELVIESGVLTEMEQNRYTLMQYDAVIRGLVENMRNAHNEFVNHFGFSQIQHETVTLEGLNEYFTQRFGTPLARFLLNVYTELKDVSDKDKNVVEQENHNLRQNLDGLRKKIDTLLKEQQAIATAVGQSDHILATFDGDPTVFENILHAVYERERTDRLSNLLYSSYYARSIDNVKMYETSTDGEELKLYHLIDYEVLTNHIRRVFQNEDTRLHESENRRLNEPQYFLDYFLNQLGNAQVERYVKRKSLSEQNKLALMLFKHYYVPVINKESFVVSIEGPFANFNMVYKV